MEFEVSIDQYNFYIRVDSYIKQPPQGPSADSDWE